MSAVAHNTPDGDRRGPRRRVGLDLGLGLGPLAAVSIATRQLIGLPPVYLVACVALYLGLAWLLVRRLPPSLPGVGLGPANRVTLFRACLLLPLGPLPVYAGSLVALDRWWIVVVATVALLLDAVDGWVARRRGSSAFGARFDMELDAVLLLTLSALVWRAGIAGPWVVLIGGLRYLFVAAGWLWPVFRAALPPSLRRKTVAALQGAALVICLGPIVPSAMAVAVAAGALSLLVYSFAVDILYLLRVPVTEAA